VTWTGFFRGLSVFLVAIGLLAGGSFFAVQYVLTQLSTPPPRPTFPNDAKAPATPAVAKKTAPSPAPLDGENPTEAAAVDPATASPSPSPTLSAEGYQAKIKLDNGLNVRESPMADAARVGGVDYNDVVTVLEESQDKEWQRIRVEKTGIEGWIKSGYAERTL
jgi:hypothetical protein